MTTLPRRRNVQTAKGDDVSIGSLFAGIDGFGLAARNVGIDCVWSAEIDPNAQSVLRRHFACNPDWQLFKDVHDVGSKTAVRPEILCGGFPCQDISVAGKRAGLAGKRSGLWWEFARCIAEFQPRWVVAENVAGLLSSNGFRDLGTILRTLGNLGYGYAYRVLDSQWFGVPQRRRRVFIVGCAGADVRRAAEVLFESESLPWDSPPSRETRAELARCLTRGSDSGSRYDGDTETFVTTSHDVASPLLAKGNSSHREDAESYVAVPYAFSAYESFSSGDGTDVSPTLKIDPLATTTQTGVRRLTPKECERLQSFPDGWTELGHDGKRMSDSARYRMLGNAVTVNVVQWILGRIARNP